MFGVSTSVYFLTLDAIINSFVSVVLFEKSSTSRWDELKIVWSLGYYDGDHEDLMGEMKMGLCLTMNKFCGVSFFQS